MSNDVLEKLLLSFQRYYDINRTGLEAPYSALAEFHSHTEKFVLVKAADIADIDTNEYVYIARLENLDLNTLKQLSESTWNKGLEKVVPGPGHQSSNISLIILADKIEESARKNCKKIKFYKSYRYSFWGWSHFKLIAADLSTGKLAYNRFGSDYKKILNNIL